MKGFVRLLWYISEALIGLVALISIYAFFRYYTSSIGKGLQISIITLVLLSVFYLSWIHPVPSKFLNVFIEHLNNNLFLWIVTQFTLLIIIKNIYNLLPGNLYKIIVAAGILGFIYERWLMPFRNHVDIIKRSRRYLFFRNVSGAITILKEGLQLPGLSPIEMADLMVILGDLHLRKKDVSAADYYFNKALKTEGLTDLVAATFYFRVGMSYFKYNNFSKSNFYFEKVLNLIIYELHEKVSDDFLLDIINSLLYTNQKQRAVEMYTNLYKKNLCKRNTKIDHLLGLK